MLLLSAQLVKEQLKMTLSSQGQMACQSPSAFVTSISTIEFIVKAFERLHSLACFCDCTEASNIPAAVCMFCNSDRVLTVTCCAYNAACSGLCVDCTGIALLDCISPTVPRQLSVKKLK